MYYFMLICVKKIYIHFWRVFRVFFFWGPCMKNDSFYVIICRVGLQGKRKKKIDPQDLGRHNISVLTLSNPINWDPFIES